MQCKDSRLITHTYPNSPSSLHQYYRGAIILKAADAKKNGEKITVKTGQVMFSGEIYYY